MKHIVTIATIAGFLALAAPSAEANWFTDMFNFSGDGVGNGVGNGVGSGGGSGNNNGSGNGNVCVDNAGVVSGC